MHDFKIEKSKIHEGTSLLTLQIEKDEEKRILFVGSKVLIQMISEVKREDLPFTTTIVKNGEHYEFT